MQTSSSNSNHRNSRHRNAAAPQQQQVITRLDFATRTANLANKNLHNRLIFDSNFAGCDLSGSDMSHGSFAMCDFTGANLTGANLTGANLTYADLSGANLTNAILYHTNLIGARLDNVKLHNTNIEAAILDPVFGGQQLSSNKHLARQQTHGAPYRTNDILCNRYGICNPGTNRNTNKSTNNVLRNQAGTAQQQHVGQNIQRAANNQQQAEQQQQPWINPVNVHVAFDDIGIDRLNDKLGAILTSQNINNPDTYYSGLDIIQFITTGLKRITSNSGLSKYNEDIDKLANLISRFNFDTFTSDAGKLNNLKILFGRTMDYLGLQSNEFIDIYLQTLIKDSLFAYGTDNNPSASCPRGVIERVVLNLVSPLTAECSVKCNDGNKQLLEIFAPPSSDSGNTIDKLASQWWQQFNDNNEPVDVGISAESGPQQNQNQVVPADSGSQQNQKQAPNNTNTGGTTKNNSTKLIENKPGNTGNTGKKNTLKNRVSKRAQFMQDYANVNKRKQKFVNNMTAKGINANTARRYANNKIGYAFNQMEI